MSRYELYHGNSREILKALADESFDSIVTDPPYHLTNRGGGPGGKGIDNPFSRARAGAASSGFMGMTWDGGDIAHDPTFWAECMRVAKPGAWLVAFGGTRTYHRLACAIEDAGWELRDSPVRGHMHQAEDCPWLHGWMFGSGFPKSRNGEWGGTALKPAWEPIVLARKPLAGTVEANWREHGTGALNIDGCRIEVADEAYARNCSGDRGHDGTRDAEEIGSTNIRAGGGKAATGRWPANLLHDGSPGVLTCFPSDAGASALVLGTEPSMASVGLVTGERARVPGAFHADTGSAARFFYCAKASAEDRHEGLPNPGQRFEQGSTLRDAERVMEEGKGNFHPTVKPTELMRWLVRLVTPAGGMVLDPFMGSGSTGKAAMLEGLRFTGIDLTSEYVAIARARIEFALRQGHQPSLLEVA